MRAPKHLYLVVSDTADFRVLPADVCLTKAQAKREVERRNAGVSLGATDWRVMSFGEVG